ncbi:MAG TPA: hypothetical protein VGN80_15475 [Devosiaceae bacterium]|jgi:hypothetical protein|nr:hypothetical protein [Devosiaceae bacterium]
MSFKLFTRIGGVILMTAGLAGCIDVDMEIAVLSETTARATTTSTMGADFYAMAKAGMAGGEESTDGFCQDEGSVLTENADGSATCVLVEEGPFTELEVGEGEDGAKFEVVSPGVVRVSLNTEDIKSEVGAAEQDEETRQMMQAFFEGHAITLRISGAEVIETNMTETDDGKAAELVIPFLSLIDGTLELPEELYATVRTN